MAWGRMCDGRYVKFKKDNHPHGEMAEWLKAHAWKACLGETLTWVRIPLSPPAIDLIDFNLHGSIMVSIKR